MTLNRDYHALLSILNQLKIGLCLVRKDGLVSVKNAEAERLLESCEGISLTPEHHLQCDDKEFQTQLELALKTACREEGEDVGLCEFIVLPKRKKASHPLLIEISPFDERQFTGKKTSDRAFVTFNNPDVVRTFSIERTAAVFGLTLAESVICGMLVEGKTSPEMAKIRRVSTETIKTQVKSVFVKTRCKRRSELIRLVTTMAV